jgi:hypothetical protein
VLQTLIPRVEELKPNDFSNYVAHGNWEKLNHFVNKQISNWYTKQVTREQEVNKKVFEIKAV